MTDYSSAIVAALDALFGRCARIGLLKPFMPVLASNLVSYWRALRACGIPDVMPQHGHLFQQG